MVELMLSRCRVNVYSLNNVLDLLSSLDIKISRQAMDFYKDLLLEKVWYQRR